MKKVLLPQKFHEDGLSVLQGQVEVIIAPGPSQDSVSRFIQDVDAVILRTTSTITRTMIHSAPNTKPAPGSKAISW